MASSLKTTVIIPKVATAKSFTWEKSDIERLVDWMEENLEALRGSRSTWIKDCKEQAFPEHGYYFSFRCALEMPAPYNP